MPISSQTVPNWSALERKILDGGYELEQCLNPTEVAARFKVRILGDRFTEAIADVFAPGALPRGQVALWWEAAAFDHPNINRPMSAGELAAEGGQWPYFVRLRPDETLGTVLVERALTVEEAREVARSITAALDYLHQNGYVHGGIAPEHVLAMGDAIQLSTLYLHRANVALGSGRAGARFRAPENPLENSTPAADIYCLGCALYEVLTGKKVTADAPADPVELPQPFAYIVDRCLEPDPEKRLPLSAIQALLEGRQIAQSITPPEQEEIHQLAIQPLVDGPPSSASASHGSSAVAPEEHRTHSIANGRQPDPVARFVAPRTEPPLFEPARSEAVTSDPALSERVAPEQVLPSHAAGTSESPAPTFAPRKEAPATPTTIDARIRERRDQSERAYSRPAALPKQQRERAEAAASKPWMWVMLAAVLLGGILWLARPKATTKPQSPVTPKTDISHTAGSTPVGGASHAVGPDSSTPGNPPLAVPSKGGNAGTGVHGLAGERVWRLVVYTFNREADAQKRADSVRQKHSELRAEVFSPRGHAAPYLVTIGGQMTRPEADRLRQKARTAGLPRDCYVQNYSH